MTKRRKGKNARLEETILGGHLAVVVEMAAEGVMMGRHPMVALNQRDFTQTHGRLLFLDFYRDLFTFRATGEIVRQKLLGHGWHQYLPFQN